MDTTWTPQDLPEAQQTQQAPEWAQTPTWADPWTGNRDTDKYWAREA